MSQQLGFIRGSPPNILSPSCIPQAELMNLLRVPGDKAKTRKTKVAIKFLKAAPLLIQAMELRTIPTQLLRNIPKVHRLACSHTYTRSGCFGRSSPIHRCQEPRY